MNSYKEVEGCLIEKSLNGEFDIIAHGCNCFCTMQSGIAPQMAKTFGCDEFWLENIMFKGDISKLGYLYYNSVYFKKGTNIIIDSETHHTSEDDTVEIVVINAYTQYEPGSNLDYEALTLCLRKINHIFKGKHIGLPLIGCGIAGGIWDQHQLSDDDFKDYENGKYQSIFVKTIIQEELKDMDVTIVHYKK